MEKQKVDWIRIGGIIGIIVAIAMIALCGTGAKQEAQYERYQFVTVSTSYEDNNTFRKIVYDPDTMVMYEITNGIIKTPLLNADGTPRTYKPE